MKYLLIVSLMAFVGCKQEIETVVQTNKETVVQKEAISQDFEGVYFFENGGSLELISGSDNEVTVMREDQYITTINPISDTISTLPQLYKTALEIHQAALRWSVDLSYVANNGFEEDITGIAIIGIKRTDIEIKLISEKTIQLTITIYKDRTGYDLDRVIAKRTLLSQ